MDRFNALGRGTQIMFVAGVLLLIDTFLPWQDIKSRLDELGLGSISEEFGVQTTANAWHGLFGVLLGLMVILLLARIVVRLAAVNIPLPVSSAMTAAVLGVLIPFFAVIKAIFQEGSTIWSYIGALLAVLVGVGAWLAVQEAGGVKTLASEIPSMPPPAASPAPSQSLATEPAANVETATSTAGSPPPATVTAVATPEPDSAPPPAKRFCENCGAERLPDTRFCTSCGQP